MSAAGMSAATDSFTPFAGMRVVTTAVNLPVPLACRYLGGWGAGIVKIEPPGGDGFRARGGAFYDWLVEGWEVAALDLKSASGRERLFAYLETADLFLTASRPRALARLGLDWPSLQRRFPRLCQVAVVGHPPPHGDRPGHDLTYQAGLGLLTPPSMPKVLIADFAGVEMTVAAAAALMLARERGQGAGYREVVLETAAKRFALALELGLTASDGILGGGFPGYNLYRAADGWIAVAALEPHFWEALCAALGIGQRGQETATYDDLAALFAQKSAAHWQAWAAERDLPVAALSGPADFPPV